MILTLMSAPPYIGNILPPSVEQKSNDFWAQKIRPFRGNSKYNIYMKLCQVLHNVFIRAKTTTSAYSMPSAARMYAPVSSADRTVAEDVLALFVCFGLHGVPSYIINFIISAELFQRTFSTNPPTICNIFLDCRSVFYILINFWKFSKITRLYPLWNDYH